MFTPPFAEGDRIIVEATGFRYPNPRDIGTLQGVLKATKKKHSKYVTWYSNQDFDLDFQDIPFELRASPDIIRRIHSVQHVCLYKAKVALNPVVLTLDDLSLAIPTSWDNRPTLAPRPTMLELFSGGFGGWSHGAHFLHMMGGLAPQIIALEKELPSATQFALTHSCRLYGDLTHLDHTMFVEYFGNTVLVGDISTHHWRQLIQWLPNDFWTVSAPCQSWTGGGHKRDFQSSTEDSWWLLLQTQGCSSQRRYRWSKCQDFVIMLSLL